LNVIHDSGTRHFFHCPGCGCAHAVDGGWTYNGDPVRPTFSPSVLAWTETTRCHSFVTDGRISFLGDSTHAFAGQTVTLPPWRGFDAAANDAGEKR
jgi:hypothetical protein